MNTGRKDDHYWQYKSKDDLLVCPKYLRLPKLCETFIFLRTLICPEVLSEEVRYSGLSISPMNIIFEKFNLSQDSETHPSLWVLKR